MSAHLEPVESFDRLRIALPVVVRGCQICGGEHSGSLVERTSRRVPLANGFVDWTICWVVTPRPECAKEVGRQLGAKPEWVVTPITVDQGRVFVVVDDADAAATPARMRKPERVE